MIVTKSRKEEYIIAKISEWVTRFPVTTLKEIARLKAKFDIKESAIYESASMNEDGEISVKIYRYLQNKLLPDSLEILKPGEKGYEEIILRHGSLSPGKGNTIKQKIVKGEWVDVSVLPMAL